MKYYLRDLYTGALQPFGSIYDLTRWWTKKLGRKEFYEFNVTGNDLHPDYDKGTLVLTLRRYQVLDENGRSVDIRKLPESIWDFPNIAYSYWPANFMPGAKSRAHRMTGPKLRRSGFRAITEPTYVTDELLDETTAAMLPHIDVNKINFHDNMAIPPFRDEAYYCKKERNKYCGSGSWKDQSKARKSWGRHKAPHMPRKRNWPTDLDFDQLARSMSITENQSFEPSDVSENFAAI